MSYSISEYLPFVLAAAVLFILYKMSNPTLLTKYPTNWTCVAGIDVPIRRENNLNNDISCLSENAKDCLWGDCNEKLRLYSLPENSNKVHPLVCTVEDYKYQNHWCNNGNNQIPRH